MRGSKSHGTIVIGACIFVPIRREKIFGPSGWRPVKEKEDFGDGKRGIRTLGKQKPT